MKAVVLKPYFIIINKISWFVCSITIRVGAVRTNFLIKGRVCEDGINSLYLNDEHVGVFRGQGRWWQKSTNMSLTSENTRAKLRPAMCDVRIFAQKGTMECRSSDAVLSASELYVPKGNRQLVACSRKKCGQCFLICWTNSSTSLSRISFRRFRPSFTKLFHPSSAHGRSPSPIELQNSNGKYQITIKKAACAKGVRSFNDEIKLFDESENRMFTTIIFKIWPKRPCKACILLTVAFFFYLDFQLQGAHGINALKSL